MTRLFWLALNGALRPFGYGVQFGAEVEIVGLGPVMVSYRLRHLSVSIARLGQ